MTGPSLPSLDTPLCEWTPRRAHTKCGHPATWWAILHDFEHTDGSDPNGTRTWMLCPDCALNLFAWALQANADGDGFLCRGCNTLIAPALGGFLHAHGELADPEQDVFFGIT